MNQQHLLLLTKRVPPRIKSRCLKRKRLDDLFSQVKDYPVTLVQAEAGYGKSTALVTHLCPQFEHLAWYTVEDEERDPFLFLRYLVYALKTVHPFLGERSLSLLQEADSLESAIRPFLTCLINELAEGAPDPTILVLDDFHTVFDVKEIYNILEWMIRYLPPQVHMVIATRNFPEWSVLRRLQSTCDLFLIGKRELVFSMEEIEQLFRLEYGLPLTANQVQELYEQTEGWIIALQMIGKGMEQGGGMLDLWKDLPETNVQLFQYLAAEVFDRQPDSIQQFLLYTSLLKTMESELCNRLMEREDSAAILAHLEREGLFISLLGSGQYRYHRLFQKFLQTRFQYSMNQGQRIELHRKAAEFYVEKKDFIHALSYYLDAGELHKVVDVLVQTGQDVLQKGQLELLKHDIDRLPEDLLQQFPTLLYWTIQLDLRLGKLFSAKELALEILRKEADSEGTRTARVQREMHLLLSLIECFTGEADAGKWHAEQGMDDGKKLQDSFAEMAGFIRLGHAYVLLNRLKEAKECYQHSIRMCEELQEERGKVEAFIGLTLVAGLSGDLEQAEKYARAGLKLALYVHDLWFANLLRVSLGFVLANQSQWEEALPWLHKAEEGFAAWGDRYGCTVARLWLSIVYERIGQHDRLRQVLTLMLREVEQEGYEFLFARRTLFGPPDPCLFVPSLLIARDQMQAKEAGRILQHMGYKEIQKHPGFTLRIFTLGTFTVFRGMEEVGRKEWKREKSRQLFQLFVTRHGQFLQREEIYEWLWADADQQTGNRDFKVALNVLINILEPNREARSESFFIERNHSAYRLKRDVAIWVDTDEFVRRAEKGLLLAAKGKEEQEEAVHELEGALHLYKGDFLQEYPYLEWCSQAREQMRTLYLRATETLAWLYLSQGFLQEAILLCERILASDACWEAAYQILMSCYHQLGNRGLVQSTYKKCVSQMEELLGVIPMAETTRLYQELVCKA